jgi:uncharacterized protein (DUF1501 family)
MKRRDFLKAAAPATVLPFLVGGYSIKAFANNPFIHSLTASGVPSNRVLVLIQLIGGNDGLNTVIPLDQYAGIMAARANIAIAESSVLKLSSTVGLHPNLAGMQNLFSDGKLAIIQNVGYPSPNFSHFRSTDIWLTGSDFNQTLPTGWIGRYLDQEYPGYPTGYPNAQMPDPIGIQIGSAVSLGYEGPNTNMGMAFSNPTAFYNIINDTTPPTPNTRAGHELAYVRTIGDQLQKFAIPVKNAAGKGVTKSTMWPTANANTLADQLRIVAQLIAGGLKTKLYVVNLGGFDSHSGQRNGQDPLLGKLSVAVSAFQNELKLNALEDRVIGMTFSEFGRRIKSNDSGGTDHGAASAMFVFGQNVVAGVHGSNPVLPTNATVDDNLNMDVDFRTIYASVLKEWFGANDAERKTTLLKDFPTIDIIQSAGVTNQPPLPSIALSQNYPNPVSSSVGSRTTKINFKTNGGFTRLRLFDTKGDLVRTFVNDVVTSGDRAVTFDPTDLASGTYFYRLESGGATATKSLVVLR